ncbi:glycosyltransferase family 1 protein [Bradyrhizobium sp. NP1]|uniref:glycosyltransferase family 4 protein n=1 Tax=Bradyrhizobium sp. NP1 TaxID=3049772 RepID=UPI0025A683DD|nr:glycosyltransferase family 1 protein [Bradyrhizobium sp. NP1]WJR81409.1 glycosyltransferase family 1 protein [Bradyrhizobium sp. NP1]
MTRVLFNMPSQYAGRPSGVARMALELLSSLIGKNDYQYVLRSPWSHEHLPACLKAKPLDVVTVPRFSSAKLAVLQQSLAFPAFCRQQEIDLVVNLDPFGSATGARARMLIVHDIYFRMIGKKVGWRERLTNDSILRLMLYGNQEIVTVSEATKRDLELWYPQSKGRVTAIHSATSIKPVDASREIPGRYVLAVGNATENKNFGVLAEAMASIHSSFPDVTLVHVGEDHNETIAGTLRRLGCELPLVRLASIDDRRLAGLYRYASCLCVPSLYEGFCLPILEAQVCGCPVICSNRSATPEIAGEGAILFDPANARELADRLKTLLADPDLSGALVRRGYENAAGFSWDGAAHQYLGVFERLLAKH